MHDITKLFEKEKRQRDEISLIVDDEPNMSMTSSEPPETLAEVDNSETADTGSEVVIDAVLHFPQTHFKQICDRIMQKF